MQLSPKFTRTALPGMLAASLMGLYLSTIAPGLTWANGGSDGGDLIAASAVGGIPHPSGYPLYLLLARVFQSLPIGALAYRTNLMSAVFAVLTSILVYSLVERHSRAKFGTNWAQMAGLSAGYAIGLSPMFWSQAVITEVYTLHGFFVALIVYLALWPADTMSVHHKRFDQICGLVYGLAAGNHLTVLLIVPVAMLVRAVHYEPSNTPLAGSPDRRPGFWIEWSVVRRQFAWMLIGLLVYLLLPLRAINHPVINWGNPVTLENFWWLVSGEIYRSYYLADAFLQFWPRTRATAGLLLQQFGLYGTALTAIQLVVFTKASRLNILTGWMGLVSLITAITYQSPDSYLYLIPFFISCSIWIGLCVGQVLLDLSKVQKLWKWLFVLSLVINFAVGIVGNWQRVDASRDHRAEDFGETIFSTAPENAILFVKGDPAIFAAWYFHYALGWRPDLSIIATDLLHFDWYQQTLRTTYPSLVVPGPFPFDSTVSAANPDREVCYVQSEGPERLECAPP